MTELLKTPDKCRDALRVTLHLVEKSLQRIHRGYRNAMYTTVKSIENKVGPVSGWKELLLSVFMATTIPHLRKPATMNNQMTALVLVYICKPKRRS